MEEKIVKLKEKLSKFETKDLLGMISTRFMTFGNDGNDIPYEADIFNKTSLLAPQKQYLYLAGLLMSTDYVGSEDTHVTPTIFKNIETNVQEITSEYILGFINLDEDAPPKSRNDIRKNFVSAEAFTSYFDTGILRYEEQTEELIKKLYSPFDEELKNITSLSISDYVEFYYFIYEAFSSALDRQQAAMEEVSSFLSSLNPHSKNIEREYQRMQDFASSGIREKLQHAINGINTINSAEIVSRFGEEKAHALISEFCLERKSRDFVYYNGHNPFVHRPLCWLDDSSLFIVHPKFLLSAIFEHITDVLEKPQNSFAEKYKRVKADTVEMLFLNCLKSLLGERAIYHTRVCEERGTKEHDILIEIENYILIAEVKASKVREPFFNPQKAYTRIHDHFHSDSGIGGAYAQAINLKKFLEQSENVTLFENKVSPFTISDISQKTILPIVLTLNQFGSLAINTSSVLEKEPKQPYPWVCNLHDLENILEINTYLHKSPLEFIDYLCWRVVYHSHVFSSDELDILEEYYLNSTVRQKVKSGNVVIWPLTVNLIDKIYFEKHGVPYHHPSLNKKTVKREKPGVNKPCPCGSGKKFKKCCRGKGIYD